MGNYDSSQAELKEIRERLMAGKVTERDENGVPARLIGTHTDITDRKKAEDRFRSLLESAPDATVIVNDDGDIVETNLQTEKLFGYATDELLGQKVEVLLPERFRDRHPAHRKEFFKHKSVRPMGIGLELYGRAKDGREFPIELASCRGGRSVDPQP